MNSEKPDKESLDMDALRITLDGLASNSYKEMEAALKGVGSHIKFQPSRFLSFLVLHYRENYFEKDRSILEKEFFDSKEYVSSALKSAQTPEAIRAVLESAMKKFKGETRGRKKSPLKKPIKEDPRSRQID